MKKRLLALHPDVLKLRNFQIVVRDAATVDAHGYVISLSEGYANRHGLHWVIISAWASALLVQLRWAMRRPQNVDE